MRGSFIIILVLALLGYTTVWYIGSAEICPTPIEYRLGAYDERFSLEKDAVIAVLQEAAAAWNKAAGRPLFIYDEKADFPINFVFDDRQRLTERQERESTTLDEKKIKMDALRNELKEIEQTYAAAKSTYEAKTEAYNQRLSRYNASIDEKNAQGGASPREIERFKKEQASLDAENRRLNEAAAELNKLVEQINKGGEALNEQVWTFNQAAAVFNEEFGEMGAFTQGKYTGNEITIFEYSNKTELRQVVAHEFGHALGIQHIEDPLAIMYYLLEQQPNELTLTPGDQAALLQVCGDGSEFPQRLRKLIRSLLAPFSA